jgi:hypothetical protein
MTTDTFLKSKGTLEKGERKTVCRHLVITKCTTKDLVSFMVAKIQRFNGT